MLNVRFIFKMLGLMFILETLFMLMALAVAFIIHADGSCRRVYLSRR